MIFTSPGENGINYFLYWDNSYLKNICVIGFSNGYVVRYGMITKGSSVIIPLYLNWPYGIEEEYYDDLVMPEIKIIAKQYTSYSGSIPMNLLGFTNLVSFNSLNKKSIILTDTGSDQYGYPIDTYHKYKFVSNDSMSGYIKYGNYSNPE